MKKYFLFLSEPEIKLILKGLSEVQIVDPAPANPLSLKANIIEQCIQMQLELDTDKSA